MFGRLTPVVKNLLLINIIIFAIQSLMGFDFPRLFGYRYIFAETFQPYHIITYMFIHSNFFHLFGNMLALFIFGPLLEQYFGNKKFLYFYMICGLGAGVLYAVVNFVEMRQMENAVAAFAEAPSPHKLLDFISNHAGQLTQQGYNFVHEIYPGNPDNPQYISEANRFMVEVYERKSNIPMVGASGAVFGILMAIGMLFPNLELFLLFPPIPIKAKYFVTFYGAFEIYSLLQNRPDDNVAHLAHIGGMIFAFVLIKYWNIKRPGF